MSAYSTRQLATLLDVRPDRVRAWARAGLVAPDRTPRGHLRFSFQDLVWLRTAKRLLCVEGNARRIWRALRKLGRQLRDGRPLCSIRMRFEGSELLATAGSMTWDAETGQALFDFSPEPASNVARLQPRPPAPAPAKPTAEEWFELGIALEQSDAPAEAESAYRQAILTDPRHVDSHVNLGRLRHAAHALEEAESLYRRALELDAAHAIAHFNLGVVLEDRGALDEAMSLYKRALALDPTIGEAHFNLARLYEQSGDEQSALRHLSSFKRLEDR
ncbi:MAG TPA: tetratricopeptide repeat protein [Gammaproteobacteria bacterium]|nr:tetratricopeptide repeat protein [Gammaproteobacteria bacterium]